MSFEFRQMTRRRKIVSWLFLAILAPWAIAPRPAVAHPMGNFSISHFAGLRIEADMVSLRYILDLAEIPTFQEMQAAGIIPSADDPRVAAYLVSKTEELKGGLVLLLNGRPLSLETESTNVIFPPGAGNLPTLKIGAIYRAGFSGTVCPCTLEYLDRNFPERAGWKEVVASAGPGATLTLSTAAPISRSQELANYPTDLINSPPQDLSAHLTFTLANGFAAGGKADAPLPPLSLDLRSAGPNRGVGSINETASGAATLAWGAGAPQSRSAEASDPTPSTRVRIAEAPTEGPSPAGMPAKTDGLVPMRVAAPSRNLTLEANRQGTPRNSFTELISSNRWGLWFMLTAALIAAALGGLHALEPGHGKTIVAAYLVGSQGTAIHALLLGLVVTATHTAGVYALGLITLYASKYVVPDHLYPWLGMASGLVIAFLGLSILLRRLTGHSHDHGHLHHHGPWGHSHEAGHSHGHTHNHGAPGHTHAHLHSHGHDHPHPQSAHSHAHVHHPDHEPSHDAGRANCSRVSYRQLVALGVTGGIVPCPAALVVLLSAVSLHRVIFGLYLIVAFSLGLAAVLISIGMITVYARRLLTRLPSDGPLINRWLPAASATAITCLGIGIAAQALLATGVLHGRV
jgi:ABC-type nickel/cobalt efflux system permease component RcnA